MTRSQQPALTLFAVGMIGLGILALVYGDFALVWQPVAPWIPGRTVLAYASGLIMLFGGVGLLSRATAAWSARILFPYLIVWLLLKVPALVVAPQMEAVWLGFGELAVLLAGGWILFARLAGLREGSPLAFATAGFCHGRERHPHCTDTLCGFSHTDRTLTSCVCEGDCGVGAGVASLSCWLGVPYRCRTDGLRSRRAVLDLSASSRDSRSGYDKPVYSSRLGSCDSGRLENAAAVDGVLHFMGDRVCRMGSGAKHRTEATCQAGCVTAYPSWVLGAPLLALFEKGPLDTRHHRTPR
jgi:hypothetical protein